ncbi:hypothetical protein PTSG_12542 [Salpingoeca rosetta]|uniref:Polynucleotide kinase 3'-phosphatase n=1 Tax=Salpingoeca rosetta (strain ATCC 50818 / BSB-021) TaxID=946362 RepID=F2UE97_SALR5|nr:uncharacterized protein PTSG_12542 [Salpingoeca rosetta]EGD74947.1 hypothetical protein PTSG_12542 [Salpingoeca rosetta]|eukprot:XP_004992592.1 hypothetical protein PTSG_12542 [Salpingoeca rosetta]
MPRRSKRQAEKEEEEAKKSKLSDGWKMSWEEAGGAKIKGVAPLLVYDGEDALKSSVVAGFDMDGTIIKTKSGRRFPTGPSDWVFWDDAVIKKLRDLHSNNTKIVFFTNQAGIEKKNTSVSSITSKIEDILETLGFPVTVLVCTGHNHYRKPSIRLWEYFAEHCNDGGEIDLQRSVFVGDAAGRSKDWKPGMKKDFSCTDRMFAANIGVPFHTPEEFFLDEPKATKYEWRAADPGKLLAASVSSPRDMSHITKKAPPTEMIVLVGSPASGKSTFAERHLKPHGYVIVNRDTLGTMAKCEKAAAKALEDGQSVVVDNTNPDPASRAKFIQIATKHSVPVRCVELTTPRDVASHLNYFRAILTDGKRRRIPDVAFNSFRSKYKAPSAGEGFDEVIKVEFVPEFHGHNKTRARELFAHWQSG